MNRLLAFIQVVAMTLPLVHNSGVPDAVVNEIAAIYQAVSDRISADVVNFIEKHGTDSQEFKRARAAQLTRRMDEHLAQFSRAVRRPVDAASKASYTLGLRQGGNQLRALGLRPKDAPVRGSFAAIDTTAIETLARDIVIASVRAADNLAETAKRVTRAIASTDIADADVSRALARGIASGDPRTAMREVRELFREPGSEESFRRLGNRTIQVGGAQMRIRNYAEMLVRTRTREAVVHARHETLQRNGVDLVIIDGRISKNFCTRYVGLICSISGSHEKWPALSSLPGGGPPFHPNCSKGTRPYVEGLSPPGEEESGQRALAELREFGVDTREGLDGDEMAAARGRI